jgi:hypothetical protein
LPFGRTKFIKAAQSEVKRMLTNDEFILIERSFNQKYKFFDKK